MKKMTLVLMLAIGTLASKAQTTNKWIECPPDYLPVVILDLDQFNFHKPRTACTSGFGFCFRVGLTITCRKLEATGDKATLINGKAHVWGSIQNETITLHFPSSLQKASGFSPEDFKTFLFEEAVSLSYGKKTVAGLIPGEYRVVNTGTDLTVTIPVKAL